MSKKHRSHGSHLSGTVMLFFFLAFLLLAARDGSVTGYILCAAVPVMIFLGTHLLPKLFPVDNLLLSLMNFLCALGILVLYSINPETAWHQVVAYGVGLICMIVCIYLVRSITSWRVPVLLLIPISLFLLALPLLSGQEVNGARSWFALGHFTFQPSEIVKIAAVIVISELLTRRRLLLCLAFVAACLGFLMLQKDLGTALIYYSSSLLLYWVSSGNWAVTFLGIAGGCGTAVAGYQMFAHVRRRVAAWQNPWPDYQNAGYQIAQGLMAIASGGLFGTGLGMGAPTSIPVYSSDYIFAVICEQFGLIFGLCVLAMYAALIWRGASIAASARRSFHSLLVMGCISVLGLQTFIIVGGVLKLIPLTGVTMPFVSYGGTSMVSSMCLTGLIQGVASLNEDDLDDDACMVRLER